MHEKTPFFSVIIPTLNEETVLPKLLRCLLNQSFQSFEVIVSDGESKDKTEQVVHQYQKKFQDKQLLFLPIARKPSVSYPRNRAAEKATGAYFVFFDADVSIGPEFLGEIYKHIQQFHPLFLTTRVVPDSTDIINRILTEMVNWSIMVIRYSSKPFILGFNIIMERSVFKKIGGFNEKALLGEDHELATAARKHGIILSYLAKPVLTCSLRRFESEGRMKTIGKYIRSTWHILTKGVIHKQLYEYNMGGAHHARKKV